MIDDLRQIVGREHVLTDADVRAGYETDWTRRYGGPARAVVRPGSSAEVAAVVGWCAARGVHIVTQGGNTGLVGGGVPPAHAPSRLRELILISTRRMSTIRHVDDAVGQATVEAGTTLSVLQSRLLGSGWEFGVDLGARDSATIGGMVATNAGGTRVLRYGSMRANLLGVEAVLGDGAVVSHLGGLLKDNTGYDLAGLLCGSEGTLGIVTAARLRLVPAWPDRLAAAVACASWADAMALAGRLRHDADGLDGLEAVDRPGVQLAEEHLGLRAPLGAVPPVTLFAVWAGRGDPPSALVELLTERHHVVGDAARILEVRERQAEAIARTGIPHKMDVTLPLERLAEFTDAVRPLAGEAALYLFGHLGDGNLHVNVVGPPPDDERVDEAVLGLVASMGGSLSAEHGIGRLKASHLHLVRSRAEIDAMRAIKRALDPRGIMNPGVIFEGD